MLDKSNQEVETTVDKFAASLFVGPDCGIEHVLPGAVPALANTVDSSWRVVAVNELPTADRGELKEVLLRAAKVNGGAIKVSFSKNNEHDVAVDIENSVVCNGKISSLTGHPEEAVREMIESISNSTPVTAVTPKHSATTALKRQASAHLTLGTVSNLDVSIADSDATSCDFETVHIGQLTTLTPSDGHLLSSPSPCSRSAAELGRPELLEFEQMRLSVRIDDGRSPPGDAGEVTIKSRLMRAINTVGPGKCVICVVQDVNPIAEIELLALQLRKTMVAIDLGAKLRLRPKPDVLAEQFAEAMHAGAWFVMVNAHKSINTCLIFDDLLSDAQAGNLQGFDPDARIIISLEPHPHFPKHLIQDAVVMKLSASFQGSTIVADSLAMSMSRSHAAAANVLGISPHHRGGVCSALASSTAEATKPQKRRVRISAAVEIVDIAPRVVVNASRRDGPIDVSGSVALVKTFSGVLNDKFLCVRNAGDPGRFAVGSSLGNLYFLDALGNSLLQAHAHDASIWDVSFTDKFHFATGCEDGTSTEWSLSTGNGSSDETTLVPTSATSFGADVYCVTHLKNVPVSPLLIGGLHNSLVIREACNEKVHLVAIPSNSQVVDCLPSSSIALVGGGDGSVSVVDVDQARTLGTLCEHTRKLPALTVRDDNQFFTGSFDSAILSWDLRIAGGVTNTVDLHPSNVSVSTTHTLKLKNYVTGLDVDGVHLAASVGENLYMWDVRKLNEVLGGYPQGWKGLSRGIKVQSSACVVVTASPDGYVRFWNYV